jgi:hypothetical protein
MTRHRAIDTVLIQRYAVLSHHIRRQVAGSGVHFVLVLIVVIVILSKVFIHHSRTVQDYIP